MRIVAPFGFYGCGNIGDEATLQGFARLVAHSGRRLDIWASSQNPRHTAHVEPAFHYFRANGRDWKRWLAKRLSSAVVVAGGTPIMDCLGRWPLDEVCPLVEEAHDRGQPVAFVGIGTEELHRSESRRLVDERLAPCVRHWTVRSYRDRARLVEYGVSSECVDVAADMAWLLDGVDRSWGQRRLSEWGLSDKRRLVGVNLVGETAVLDREPALFEKVADFLDELVESEGAFVVFLANEVRDSDTFDTAAARRTQKSMKRADQSFIAPNEYLAPQQMMSLIANCEATVSMRYHFCLFSALQCVPFMALIRSDKIADLCSDLEWKCAVELNEVLRDDLVSAFRNFAVERASLIHDLMSGVATLRNRAINNLAALESLCSAKCSQATYRCER